MLVRLVVVCKCVFFYPGPYGSFREIYGNFESDACTISWGVGRRRRAWGMPALSLWGLGCGQSYKYFSFILCACHLTASFFFLLEITVHWKQKSRKGDVQAWQKVSVTIKLRLFVSFPRHLNSSGWVIGLLLGRPNQFYCHQ